MLVVADDPLTRAGLVALLGAQPEVQTAGQTVSREVAGQLAVYEPAVILWDVGGEPANAFDRIAALDDLPEAPPPVVALLSDESQAAGAWLVGARGVFLRTARLSHIVAGLIAVAQGVISLDPGLVTRLIAPREITAQSDPLMADLPSAPLTAREKEVLHWLANGLANKAIAQRLTISESTVKFHVNAILGKLGAESRTDAVVRATRLGLVSV